MARIRDRLFELPVVYRAWQAPFIEQKLRPLRQRGEIARATNVLDVGCGPGTNTLAFEHAEYLGVDINPDYIATASKRFGRPFLTADVVTFDWPADKKFDFILVNSLLHHLSTPEASRLLAALRERLAPDGHIHVVDLVLPQNRASFPWMLAKLDRGDFARPLDDLRALVSTSLDVVEFEPVPLRLAGVTLWDCVYFKARAKAANGDN
jgi:SAM-dependent methyltransferase